MATANLSFTINDTGFTLTPSVKTTIKTVTSPAKITNENVAEVIVSETEATKEAVDTMLKDRDFQLYVKAVLIRTNAAESDPKGIVIEIPLHGITKSGQSGGRRRTRMSKSTKSVRTRKNKK